MVHVALPQGLRTSIGSIGIPNNAAPTAIRKAWGYGDAGSLLDPAITWSHLQSLSQSQFWIVHLWSPGMSLLEVPLIWCSKIIPMFWSLLALTFALWLLVFRIILQSTQARYARWLVVVTSFILIESWDFKYILRDSLFYTEGISTGLLCLGLLLLWENSRAAKFTKSGSILPGILIGISVWVRHVIDSGLIFALIFSCIYIFYEKRKTTRILNASNPKSALRTIKHHANSTNSRIVLTALLVAVCVTIPWRLASEFVYGGPPLVMSSASSDVFVMAWSPDSSDLTKYWGYTGSNWACKTDPSKCIELANQLPPPTRRTLGLEAIKSIIHHPFAFFKTRLKYLIANWVPGGMKLNWSFDSFYGLAGIVSMIASLLLIVRKLWFGNQKTMAILWGSFFGAQLLQLLFMHFETRYFIPVRIMSIFLVLLHVESIGTRLRNRIQIDRAGFPITT